VRPLLGGESITWGIQTEFHYIYVEDLLCPLAFLSQFFSPVSGNTGWVCLLSELALGLLAITIVCSQQVSTRSQLFFAVKTGGGWYSLAELEARCVGSTQWSLYITPKLLVPRSPNLWSNYIRRYQVWKFQIG